MKWKHHVGIWQDTYHVTSDKPTDGRYKSITTETSWGQLNPDSFRYKPSTVKWGKMNFLHACAIYRVISPAPL